MLKTSHVQAVAVINTIPLNALAMSRSQWCSLQSLNCCGHVVSKTDVLQIQSNVGSDPSPLMTYISLEQV